MRLSDPQVHCHLRRSALGRPVSGLHRRHQRIHRRDRHWRPRRFHLQRLRHVRRRRCILDLGLNLSISGLFPLSPMPPHHAVCCGLLRAPALTRAYSILAGACDPMVCPIHVLRPPPASPPPPRSGPTAPRASTPRSTTRSAALQRSWYADFDIYYYYYYYYWGGSPRLSQLYHPAGRGTCCTKCAMRIGC